MESVKLKLGYSPEISLQVGDSFIIYDTTKLGEERNFKQTIESISDTEVKFIMEIMSSGEELIKTYPLEEFISRTEKISRSNKMTVTRVRNYYPY